MIAYCGIDCSKCEGYLATQSGDEQQQAQVAQDWSRQFNVDIKPENVICDGCKAEKRKSIHCANTCNIRKCCIDKKIESCIECEDFPCDDEKNIVEHVPEAKNNLESLKK